ncbi:MAG: hypothetical protein QM756_11990 [Polyangiaceae bacterium]
MRAASRLGTLLTISAGLWVTSANAQQPTPGQAARPAASDFGSLREQRMRDLQGHAERLRHFREQRRHVEELKSDIDREIAAPQPNKEQLQRKLEEYRGSRDERRRQTQFLLQHRYGDQAQSPALRAELARHARLVARLERIRFLAATERAGAQRKRLLDRTETLRKAEDERHRRALASLLPAPSPSAAATPSASVSKP